MLLGIPGDNTFSNYQEANRTFWRQTVLPLVERMISALNEWLTQGYTGALALKSDIDNIDALSSERDAQWARLEKASFLTDDEKRAAIGYGPLPAQQKFNPGQARKPSGKPGGGQWTKPGGDGGGGPGIGDGAVDSNSPDPAGESSFDISPDGDFGDQPPVDATDNEALQPIADKRRYTVTEHELRNYGHTFKDHVGKSDAELIADVESDTYRIGNILAGKLKKSSFLSDAEALDVVNQSLKRNEAQVDLVADGWSNQQVLNTRFGSPTGKEAHRDTPADPIEMRDTYEVRVIIRRNKGAPNGYSVLTAFPYNRLPR